MRTSAHRAAGETRPSENRSTTTSNLRDASSDQPPLIEHRIRREARHGTPFASRCRDVKVGNPVAKSIYVSAATFCDVWVDEEVAVCWPSLETIRVSTEWGRTAFMEGWRFLIGRGLVATRRGRGKKILRVPSSGGVVREVPRGDTSRSAARRHITDQGTCQEDPSLDPSSEKESSGAARTTHARAAAPAPLPLEDDRHHCPCGNSWPKRYGPVCNSCGPNGLMSETWTLRELRPLLAQEPRVGLRAVRGRRGGGPATTGRRQAAQASRRTPIHPVAAEGRTLRLRRVHRAAPDYTLICEKCLQPQEEEA